MGNQINTLFPRIGSHFLHIIVRRGAGEIERRNDLGALPGIIPALEQNALDVVFRGTGSSKNLPFL